MMKLRKKRKNKKGNVDINWVIKLTICAFIISLCFSFLSETILPNTPTIVGMVILIIFILLGIVFDMVGVSITVADEKPFHSMNSRKIRGASMAILLKKNADKVSSFCCDVIGDICGIVSGSAGVIVATSISDALSIQTFYVSLIITALIAALTIGGKAMGKGLAIKNSNKIIFMFAKTLSYFKKV